MTVECKRVVVGSVLGFDMIVLVPVADYSEKDEAILRTYVKKAFEDAEKWRGKDFVMVGGKRKADVIDDPLGEAEGRL